jgi:hypothetical protein
MEQSGIKIISGGVIETVEGEYVPHEVKDARSGFKAALHIVLKHTADIFEAVVGIVAEKYELDQEEMLSMIVSHPKWSQLQMNPVLHDLGYGLAPAAAVEAPVEAPVAPQEPKKRVWSEEAKKKAAEKRAAAKAAKTAAAAAAPAPVPAPAPAEEPKKIVRTFKIKPKSKTPTEETQ